MLESATRASLLRRAGGLAVRASLAPTRRSRRRERAGPGGRRRLQLRGLAFRLLLVLYDSQSRNILLVLLVTFCKSMSAGAVGDKIEILRACWIGGSRNRSAAGSGDGTRRKAVNDIGVVWRGLRDVSLAQRPPKRTLDEDDTLNNRGIRLQLHLLLEAIRE